MHKEIWILGAAGRTGRAIATNLSARKLPLVLVGRDQGRLDALAAQLGGEVRVVVAPSFEATVAALGEGVVVNTIGPFATTAAPVIRAGKGRSDYVDLTNELPSALEVLALNDEAVAAGRTLVTGAGWGVLGTESVTLKLCEGRPAAHRVRVDMIPRTDDGGQVGEALAGSIVDSLVAGGRRYEGGQLVRAGFGSERLVLTLPDGSSVTTALGPFAELEAARRASGAAFVVSASSMAPSGLGARLALPALGAVLQVKPLRELMKRRLAKMEGGAPKDRRDSSWAHARVEWSGGEVREGWLRAPEGMTFTSRVAAEVAARLARGEGRPGAFTPGALFGASLAEAAGGVFMLDGVAAQ